MNCLENQRASFVTKTRKLNIPRRSVLRLPFVLFFLFAVSSAWAVDPSRHISQYAHSAWRIQEGVFSGAPRAITQTTDGYLWIGTETGLLRFDGVRFVPWTPPDGKHLPSSFVSSLLAARDGSLWIGMEGGLSHWDNQHLTSYLIKTGRSSIPLLKTAMEPSGSCVPEEAIRTEVSARSSAQACGVMARQMDSQQVPTARDALRSRDSLGNLLDR